MSSTDRAWAETGVRVGPDGVLTGQKRHLDPLLDRWCLSVVRLGGELDVAARSLRSAARKRVPTWTHDHSDEAVVVRPDRPVRAPRGATGVRQAPVVESPAASWEPDPRLDRDCAADWRRPDGYWRCTREAGHAGRHRMR